jgi:UDPglucose--hexose-1-phosphate uridylyltransferase
MPDPARQGQWQVRGFANKYAALEPGNGLATTPPTSSLFVASPGLGEHEVLVETPIHNHFPALRTSEDMLRLYRAYQQRQLALMKLPFIQYVLIFKNHGRQAGTSQEHPHSQIIALPIVPDSVQKRGQIARKHYDVTKLCLLCQIKDEESQARSRVVFQDEQFTVFHPFAASRPAETWIVPSEHRPSFEQVGDEELTKLASVALKILQLLRSSFGDPDFNYILHTSPRGAAHESPEYWHWYLQIIPRITTAAGFELGSGIHINPMPPEQTAEIMRQTKV